jgi:hypothetical protein
MSFDVSTVQVSDTTEITINHPSNGEPFMVDVDGEASKKPMIVVVHGPGSKVFKAAQAVSQKAYNATFTRGKSRETSEQTAARSAAFLSACTLEFKHFNYKGKPNDRETFRELYLDEKAGWITEQVNEQMGDWANFTQAAPTS